MKIWYQRLLNSSDCHTGMYPYIVQGTMHGFLYRLKNKIIFYFVIFVAKKKVWQQIFFPYSFVAVVGSGIRGRWDYILYVNPNQDPGSGMNIPDITSENLVRYTFFGLKILKFCDTGPDPGCENRIWDKQHPTLARPLQKIISSM